MKKSADGVPSLAGREIQGRVSNDPARARLMATAEILEGLVQQLRRRCGDGPADGELLVRFAEQRDEAAFAELVGRHGGLVMGVARRHLPDRHAAEDVFQATFLALARNARRLGRSASLVNWLYVVALRQARKARLRFARGDALLKRLPAAAAVIDPLAEVTGRELVTIIDDELARLPADYRLPLLLCALEGLSREEAARRLGWPTGSVKGRLERGRELLRARLTKRGLTVPAVLAGGVLATPAEAMPATLVTTVTRAALTVPAAAGWAAPAMAVLVIGVGLAVGVMASRERQRPEDGKGVHPPVADAPGSPPAVPEDPLPAGAILRFGTARYRHVTRIEDLAVSADGTFAVANSRTIIHGALRSYDLATGRVLRTFHDSEYSGDDVGTIAYRPTERRSPRPAHSPAPTRYPCVTRPMART